MHIPEAQMRLTLSFPKWHAAVGLLGEWGAGKREVAGPSSQLGTSPT